MAPVPRLAIFGVLLLLVTWRVLHVNAVAYGETNRPVQSVPAEGEARRGALEAELSANPANVGALIQLGIEQERAGNPAGAARAYASALEIAPIDRASLRAAAALAVREGRVAEAMPRLDRLLTYYGDTREWIFPTLMQWLEVPEASAALQALAGRPSTWMAHFLAHACGRVDPTLEAPVLVRWAAAGQARKAEVGCEVDALRRAGHWEMAYHVWLNSLPRARLADIGFVFNGGFEQEPSGIGFDWIADARSPVHAIDYPAAGTEGKRALRSSWSGKRVTTPAIYQYMVLAPGRYQLSGAARMEGLQSVRGIQWSVRCADERRSTLGASPKFLGTNDWQRFSFDVEVPARCAGQVVQLEPVGLNEGTTYVAGKAWFDDLRLARAN